MNPHRSTAFEAILCLILALAASGPAGAQCTPDEFSRTIINPGYSYDDHFGLSVAISGGLAIVGANSGDDPNSGVESSGIAFVFNIATGALVRFLSDPAPMRFGNFGASVAVSGGLAVVGTDWAGVYGAPRLGVAYVFDLSTGAHKATLNDPNPYMGYSYGWAIAIDGNLVAVADPVEYLGPSIWGNGTVDLFDATTGALLRTLRYPPGSTDVGFGTAVALSGSVVVVGAARYENPSPSFAWSGIAYVYDAGTGALLQTLANPDPGAGREFGSTAAISGNLALIGVASDDSTLRRIYVFDIATGALVRTLDDPDPAGNAEFGVSLAVSGEIAAVGAYPPAPGLGHAGKVYLFNVSTGGLLATLSNPQAILDNTGSSVAISEGHVLTGAWSADPGGLFDSGIAHIFKCFQGRPFGDFDSNRCTDMADFLFILDNWYALSNLGPPDITLDDFFNFLDNWQQGTGCS